MNKRYLIFALFFLTFITNLRAQCDSYAGTMTSTLLADCMFGNIDVPIPTDIVLEVDDILFYAIHDSASNSLGNVIAIVPNPSIDFQAGMEYGIIYYVSTLVGNTTDNGFIDLDDPCLNVAVGTPILFEAIPIIEVENNGLVCSGEEITINCIVPDDYSFFMMSNTENPAEAYPFNTNEVGIYQIFLTSPDNCAFNETFEVSTNELYVDILPFESEINCDNQEAFLAASVYQASTSITGYEWSTGQFSFSGLLIVDTPGIYTVSVTDLYGCTSQDSIEVTGYYADCATISGKLVKDENDNCSYDDLETALSGKMIRAVNTEGETFAMTDAEGNFSLRTPTGTYEVEALNPLTEIWENCFTQEVILDVEDETVIANFALNPIIDCPLLSVNLATGAFRPCFESSYAVSCCNDGTIPAEEAYIEITFDEDILVLGATVEYISLEPNLYRFDIGTISIGECGNFWIDIQTSCDAEFGQTICNQAVGFPNESCISDPIWNGASIEISGECSGEEVIFNIQNVGTADMDEPLSYIVMKDGELFYSEPIDFELDADATLLLSFPANGSTYVVQTIQVAGYPGFSSPSSFVEACGVNEQGGVSQGFITQFPLDENNSWISIDCIIVTGSYDPNDKAGAPRGYGDNHYIDKGQDIEYLVRFQNTGTDTAFTVRIDDVLAPELDITTLRPGASSHSYELNIRGADTLEFLFENILLPDSFVNEVASHGFVQFKISQKENLELGTIIENTADIYFDFNEAIITNTTFHELGERFIDATSTQAFFKDDLHTSISPNPVQNEFQLNLSEIEFNTGRIDFFDVNGRMTYLKTFTDSKVALQRKGLPDGIYFYKIYLDEEFAASGKVIFVP